MTHRIGRSGRQYIEDHPDKKVYPKDYTTSNRPKGSWTNGVEAWSKEKGDVIVGWFHPPRLRNKGWLRWSRSQRKFVPRPIRHNPLSDEMSQEEE